MRCGIYTRYWTLAANSSNAAIKAAYRGLAKQSHPDLHLGDGEAENRTKEINNAYTILGDPVLRAAYDEELDMLSAKERKVAFMNASAIAAGIAFLAIAAARADVHGNAAAPRRSASTKRRGRAAGPDPHRNNRSPGERACEFSCGRS